MACTTSSRLSRHQDTFQPNIAGDRQSLALPDDAVDSSYPWRATETSWRTAVPELDNTVAPTDARHSYAVLRGLTSRGGGMDAATMSLPERANADRNYGRDSYGA